METLENDYDAELAILDEKIRIQTLKMIGLKEQRHKLLTKIRDVDMDLVLQCIEEKGLSSNEVLEIINSAAGSKMKIE